MPFFKIRWPESASHMLFLQGSVNKAPADTMENRGKASGARCGLAEWTGGISPPPLRGAALRMETHPYSGKLMTLTWVRFEVSKFPLWSDHSEFIPNLGLIAK